MKRMLNSGSLIIDRRPTTESVSSALTAADRIPAVSPPIEHPISKTKIN